MQFDGYGLMVNDIENMIHFYQDVLGFKIKNQESTDIAYLVNGNTGFIFYKCEKSECKKFHEKNEYREFSVYFDTFDEVDSVFQNVVRKGAKVMQYPTKECLQRRAFTIKDPEGNRIEICSCKKPFENNDD